MVVMPTCYITVQVSVVLKTELGLLSLYLHVKEVLFAFSCILMS